VWGSGPRLLLKIETSEGISGWGECYNHGPDRALPPLLDIERSGRCRDCQL